MKKFFLIVLLILACAAAFCQQTDTIKFYTTWDDDMLYIAVAAQGPDIRAVHKDFNKPVDGDDGVSVFLNLSEDRSGAAYTDKTALISVSCAGGFEFRRGNGTELVREDIFSHRYAVDVQGNLNDTGNIDSGYSIELALPWALMGGSNMSYKAVGIDFRITVCGKDYYLTGSDSFAKPDKCWDLLLSKFSAVTTKGAHKIVSNHYMAEPRINGEIKENEWYSRTAYVIEVPVDGGDPYTLVFSDQPVKAMLFDPAKGDKGFLDDPVRVGYIRQAASALAAEGADVLVIPAGNPYLHQIFEALKTGLEEGAATTPVSPSLSGSADPQKDLFAFYSLLPEQLRRTAVDSNGDPGLPVYTDSPDEGLEKAFFEKFGRRLLFRDQAALAEEALTERPKKAYSYVICGLDMPSYLNSKIGRQSCVTIKNTGTVTWKAGEAGLCYRWYVGGRFYSNGIAVIPIMTDIAPGAVCRLSTVLAPITEKHKPLPAGEAICELDIITVADGKSMSKPESESFFFKTNIEEPATYVDANVSESKAALAAAKAKADKPYVTGAEEPFLMAPGGSYRIVLSVMNTSCGEWDKEKVCVEALLCLLDPAGNVMKEYKGRKAALALKENTADGTIGVFDGTIETGNMRLLSPGAGEYYAIKYTLVDKKTRTPLRSHTVLAAATDDNQRLIALKAPEKEDGVYKLPVAVRNAGIRRWQCADTYIAASLYSADGTLLKKDVFKDVLLAPSKKAKYIDQGATVRKTITFKGLPEGDGCYIVAELRDGDRAFGNGVLEHTNDRLILWLDGSLQAE